MSIWNVIVAASNVVALMPLHVAWERKDLITFIALGFVTTASFVSHLFASHNHGQLGFGCHKKISRMLDACDLLGVVLLGVRLLHLFVQSENKPIIMRELSLSLVYCLIMQFLAGYDKTPSSRVLFVVVHLHFCLACFFFARSVTS